MTGYSRQFVPRYSEIAIPLTDLLRDKSLASKQARKVGIPWGMEQEQSVLALKNALTSHPILVYPDWDRKFILHTHESELATGAALTKEVESCERFVVYASQKISRADVRKSPTVSEDAVADILASFSRPHMIRVVLARLAALGILRTREKDAVSVYSELDGLRPLFRGTSAVVTRAPASRERSVPMEVDTTAEASPTDVQAGGGLRVTPGWGSGHAREEANPRSVIDSTSHILKDLPQLA